MEGAVTKQKNKRKISEQGSCAEVGKPEDAAEQPLLKKSYVKGMCYGNEFFNVPCLTLAHNMLGQILVRITDDGQRLSGRIVETECYLGGEDKASCSYMGKQTPRNVAMFMKPGTAFVYMTYGMYYCFNISSKGEGAAVLLRALEPLEGLDRMKENRSIKRKDGGASLKEKELCNGPSKLCQALHINKELMDQKDLTSFDRMWIEKGEDVPADQIVATSRIGIGPSAGDWQKKPLRFYVRDCIHISVRDKKAELDSN